MIVLILGRDGYGEVEIEVHQRTIYDAASLISVSARLVAPLFLSVSDTALLEGDAYPENNNSELGSSLNICNPALICSTKVCVSPD